MKDFFATLRRTSEPHIVVDTDGEPTVVVLPYDRYRSLVEKEDRRIRSEQPAPRQQEESRKTVLLTPDTMVPKPDAYEDTGEPHFQFEPLPEEEDLTQS